MSCRVHECDRPVRSSHSKGLCSVHYQRVVRYGDTAGGRNEPVTPRGFAGLGIIRCGICGDPVRDHAIGPCPKADVEVFR